LFALNLDCVVDMVTTAKLYQQIASMFIFQKKHVTGMSW